LLNREKGHWEALIVELGSPNYAKVGAKMMDLEGNEVDVPGATGKGPSYRYFGATKFLPILKEIFDKPPRGEKEEV
jgi:pre-mRNA-splicing factor ISY1